MEVKKITYIDLFAGAGGLSEGFMAQGSFLPIAHVEMNKHAANTLRTRSCYYYLKKNNLVSIYNDYLLGKISREELYSNIPTGILDAVINEEISSASIKHIFDSIDSLAKEQGITDIDMIIGGPPCQAYSLIGRAADANNMEKDQRNFLYKQYIKFLKHYNPKTFLFENVPGILTAGKGKSFKKIIGAFRVAGYNVEYRILDAFDYGVLQKRSRVIIFGWRQDLSYFYPTPCEQHYNATVNSLLSDLAPLVPGETNNRYISPMTDYLSLTGIRLADDILTLHTCRSHNSRDLKTYACVIDAWNNHHQRLKYSDLPSDLGTRENKTSFSDRYKLVAGDIPYSHTMIAHIAKDGHYFIHPDIKQCRSLSIREAARIQSFPDNFFFEGSRYAQFSQIGNAVPPLMALALADAIAKEFMEDGD
jgi:DNA (cytosine-5)-methyltransferase 1